MSLTKIVECVPNFSEGRDKKIIDQICSAIKTVETVELLDVDMGSDTNRTVVTFIAESRYIASAAYKGIEKAAELIDMRKHTGAHPRMGATDVCPFIPVSNTTMEECVEIAKSLGENVGKNLGIPIFLYESAAVNEDRQNLANIRNGEYEGFNEKLKDQNWKPDFGPSKLNVKSGVTAVGAREFLIAYNINLNTTDKKIATDIALDIREAGRLKRDKNGNILRDSNGKGIKKPGKFKFCKAVGWYIDEYKQAQVSINLTDYTKTPIFKVFEEVNNVNLRFKFSGCAE